MKVGNENLFSLPPAAMEKLKFYGSLNVANFALFSGLFNITLSDIIMLVPFLRGRNVVNNLALAGNSQGWFHGVASLGEWETYLSLPYLIQLWFHVCVSEKKG